MPLNQHKTEPALQRHRKNHQPEHTATPPNTTTEKIQHTIKQHNQQTKPKKA